MAERYREIFAQFADALFIENSAGAVTDANPAAVALVGLTPDRIIGRPLSQILAPATYERLIAHRASPRGIEALHMQAQLLAGHGTPVNVALSVSQLVDFDRDGNIHYLHLARSTTSRDELERELRLTRSAAGLGYGENLPATFYINARNEVSRYPPLAPGARPRALDGVAQLFATPVFREPLAQGWRGEEVRLPVGWYDVPIPGTEPLAVQKRWMRVAIVPLRLHSGDVSDLCVRVLDETETFLAGEERRWREQQYCVELATEALQHHLSSLLGVILAQASALRLSFASSELPPPALASVLDAAQNAASVLRRSSPLHAEIVGGQNIDLRALARDCAAQLAHIGGERVQVRLTEEGDIPAVCGHPDLLRTMILAYGRTLLTALPTGNCLVLRLFVDAVDPNHPSPRAGLSLGDDGHGKVRGGARPSEDLTHARELSVARAILRALGGECDVLSTASQGTLVELRLPAARFDASFKPDPRAPANSSTPGILAVGSRGRLLLADDEENFRLFAAWALKERGYEVTLARDGQEALERFQESPQSYRMVILDAYMPRMGGLEAYLRMQALRTDLPVLFASGFVRGPSADILVSGCPGPSSIIHKPFSSDELLAAVKKALEPQAVG